MFLFLLYFKHLTTSSLLYNNQISKMVRVGSAYNPSFQNPPKFQKWNRRYEQYNPKSKMENQCNNEEQLKGVESNNSYWTVREEKLKVGRFRGLVLFYGRDQEENSPFKKKVRKPPLLKNPGHFVIRDCCRIFFNIMVIYLLTDGEGSFSCVWIYYDMKEWCIVAGSCFC